MLKIQLNILKKYSDKKEKNGFYESVFSFLVYRLSVVLFFENFAHNKILIIDNNNFANAKTKQRS